MQAAGFGAQRAIVAGVFCLAAAVTTADASEPSVFLIEENWEMTINEPDPLINSPQIAFFTYPNTDCEECFFQLQMNYAAEDGYSSGGFRVSAVSDDQPVDEERSVIRKTLSMDGDRLEWTSAMAVFNGKLMYAVKDGWGAEWGAFGGPDYLVEMDNHGMSDLSGYSPVTSIDAVDIGFGSNRVASIRLKSVKVTYTDGHSTNYSINRYVKQVEGN